MSPLRLQERDFEGFRWHSDSGFQLGEHGLFGAKFESLDGAMSLYVDCQACVRDCGSGRWIWTLRTPDTGPTLEEKSHGLSERYCTLLSSM